MIASNPESDEGSAPDLAQCQSLIDRRGPGGWTILDLKWSSYFHIHSRRVSDLRKGHILLVGDAAHIHSPALAQGMNTGIQDAFNLGWKLALVANGCAEADLLDTYHDERMPVIRHVLSQTTRVTEVGSEHSGVAIWLRDHLLPTLTSIPHVRDSLENFASELAVNYHESEISVDRGPHHGPKAGERVTDFDLVKQEKPVRLYELLRESGQHLLVIDDGSLQQKNIDELMEFCTKHLTGQVKLHIIGKHGTSVLKGHDRFVYDSSGEFHQCFGEGPSVYVIRPDGYIGAKAVWGSSEEALGAYFQELSISC